MLNTVSKTVTKNDKTLAVRMPEAELEEVVKLAAKNDRKPSSMVRIIVREYLERVKKGEQA